METGAPDYERPMYGTSPNSDGTSFFGGYSGNFFLFFSRRWTNGGRGLLVRRSINRLLLCVFPVQASHYLPVHLGPASNDPSSSSSPPHPPRRRAFTPRSGALDSLSAVVVTVICRYAAGVRRTAVLLLCWRISLGGQGGAGGPCRVFPLVSRAVNAVVVVFLGGQGGGDCPCCGFPLVSGAVNKIVLGAFDKPAVVVEVGGVHVVVVVVAVGDQTVGHLVTER